MPYPSWTENGKDGSRTSDVYSRMLQDRIVFLIGPVGEDNTNHLIAQLLLLESEKQNAPIVMYINSPGGAVTHGMALYDTMQYIKSPIHTVVLGQAASMASLLACAGDKRTITQNSRHLIHQPLGGASGQASDVEIQAKELLRWKKTLTEIYVKHTGQKYETLEHAMDRDNIMTAEESVAYGLADEVIQNREEI